MHEYNEGRQREKILHYSDRSQSTGLQDGRRDYYREYSPFQENYYGADVRYQDNLSTQTRY